MEITAQALAWGAYLLLYILGRYVLILSQVNPLSQMAAKHVS